MLCFWDVGFSHKAHRSGTQNSILPNERFIIGFLTCSDGTGTMGGGTAQVAFSTLLRDVLKNVSIEEERGGMVPAESHSNEHWVKPTIKERPLHHTIYRMGKLCLGFQHFWDS